MNEPRRTDGDGRGDGIGSRRNLWTRREFLAAGSAFAGLAAVGLAAGGSLTAAPADPSAPAGGGPAPSEPKNGAKRAFTHRGKKVEIVEDAGGADLSIDGKKVRAKKVSGMYRTPGFAFLPAHTPEELAKGLIDYELALEAKAAGRSAAGTVGAAGAHEGGH